MRKPSPASWDQTRPASGVKPALRSRTKVQRQRQPKVPATAAPLKPPDQQLPHQTDQGQSALRSAADDCLQCSHFPQCSGCSITDDSWRQPPVALAARAFFTQLGLPHFDIVAGELHGWRCRAKLAVRGSARAPVLGLFAAGSHHAVDIPNCRTHHPSINAAAELIRQMMRSLRTAPYDEATGAGDLRYVQLTVTTDRAGRRAEDDPGAQVQVVLVCNGAPGAASPARSSCTRLAQQLWAYGGSVSRLTPRPLLHSVWLSFQPDRSSNVVLGSGFELLYGPQHIWQSFGGAAVCLGPGSFVQINFASYQACLRELHKWVPPQSTVLELHAGVGAIGLSVAAACRPRSLTCVEINPNGQPAFEQSRALLPEGTNVKYRVAAASDVAEWIADAEVVILDPPRKGLEPGVLEALCRGGEGSNTSIGADKSSSSSENRTLVYLSCGFDALRRECGVLLESGRWQLVHAQAFLFFPGTDSIETLAIFKTKELQH